MPDLALFGVTGRMGQTLVRLLREAPPVAGHADGACWSLVGAVASPQSPRLGQDAAADGAPLGVTITGDAPTALKGASVAIDFSVPAAIGGNARACLAAGVPLLVGTTGFDATVRESLRAAAAVIPVLIAPNTSWGVSVVARLVGLAAALLVGADVEISEAHHRMKRDAPSGTALALGAVVADTRGHALEEVAVFDRHGVRAVRGAQEIGFSSVRAGDIIGEHCVTFAMAGERVDIIHRATERSVFARGALRAAAWLEGRPPGLYGMDDLLGAVDSDRGHR